MIFLLRCSGRDLKLQRVTVSTSPQVSGTQIHLVPASWGTSIAGSAAGLQVVNQQLIMVPSFVAFNL